MCIRDRVIAGWVADVVESRGEAGVVERVRGGVRGMCAGFPLYGGTRDVPHQTSAGTL